jgi:ketosteroid isomerase-like protein
MSAKATVEKLYAAFAAGDVPAVLGLLDESVEWTEAAGFIYLAL